MSCHTLFQSDRFFNALKGHGALCRLVVLPFESHGYNARESIMHVLWETDRWLQTYCVDSTDKTIEAKNEIGETKSDSQGKVLSASGGGEPDKEGTDQVTFSSPRASLW